MGATPHPGPLFAPKVGMVPHKTPLYTPLPPRPPEDPPEQWFRWKQDVPTTPAYCPSPPAPTPSRDQLLPLDPTGLPSVRRPGGQSTVASPILLVGMSNCRQWVIPIVVEQKKVGFSLDRPVRLGSSFYSPLSRIRRPTSSVFPRTSYRRRIANPVTGQRLAPPGRREASDSGRSVWDPCRPYSSHRPPSVRERRLLEVQHGSPSCLRL
jgi:hypothetical protein